MCDGVCFSDIFRFEKQRLQKYNQRNHLAAQPPLPCRNSEDPLGITDPLMKTQALKCYIYTNLAAQVSHSLNGQLQTSTIWGGKNIPRSSSETQTQMMQCKLSKMHNLILEMTWLSFFFLSYFCGTREVATSEVHFFSFLFLLSTDLGGKSSLSGVLLSSKSK